MRALQPYLAKKLVKGDKIVVLSEFNEIRVLTIKSVSKGEGDRSSRFSFEESVVDLEMKPFEDVLLVGNWL